MISISIGIGKRLKKLEAEKITRAERERSRKRQIGVDRESLSGNLPVRMFGNECTDSFPRDGSRADPISPAMIPAFVLHPQR